MIHLLFILTRDSALFQLPGLRRIRQWIVCQHYNNPQVRLARYARLYCAHPSPGAVLKTEGLLELGRRALVDYSGGLYTGTDVYFGEDVKVITHVHPVDGPNDNFELNPIRFCPLHVGAYAKVLANAILLPQVGEIGAYAIIGAGAVVTAPVPAYAVAAGNPAKVLRYRRVGPDFENPPSE
ncbi:MAG: hypothetical protein KGS48_18795 [Bacteroidetes bacterium]|nr:hypothetical protein [Bacteroidota bacterium]